MLQSSVKFEECKAEERKCKFEECSVLFEEQGCNTEEGGVFNKNLIIL